MSSTVLYVPPESQRFFISVKEMGNILQTLQLIFHLYFF